MKQRLLVFVSILMLGILTTSCDLLLSAAGGDGMEATQVALAIQQTSMAMEQTRLAVVEPEVVATEPPLQPTFTPYPTYTPVVVEEPPAEEEPPEVVVEPPTATATLEPSPEPEPEESFEDWLESVNILLYDDMFGFAETRVIQNAIDALGLGKNTTNVNDAMGDLLSNMNSAVQWDLIIIGAESRQNISGEYFDVVADQMDRGTAFIIEIWYIDDISAGRIQPVMQRCGIAFHQDWWRDTNSDLNGYPVYLLDPMHPLFAEPNLISMLTPYDVLWFSDVGDLIKLNAGSDAVLLGGKFPKELTSYGLMAECMDGRMIWQTFSTHDYKTQSMINLWQNYIIYTLKARYAYLQE